MTPLVIFPFFNIILFIYLTISLQKGMAFFLTRLHIFFFSLIFYIVYRKINREMEIRKVTAGNNMC